MITRYTVVSILRVLNSTIVMFLKRAVSNSKYIHAFTTNIYFPCSNVNVLYEMFCLFVVFPSWVVLPLLFIGNKASAVAKVGLRLPGSLEHLGAPEPGAV